MSPCVVYEKEGISCTFDESQGVLALGLQSCPGNDEIDKMWTIVSSFLSNYPDQCILHIAHVESPELEPPQLPTLLHIVSKIVTDFSQVSEKCAKVIVQPKYIDQKVLFAQQVFMGLLTSRVSLEIIDDPLEVAQVIKRVVRRNKKKSTLSCEQSRT